MKKRQIIIDTDPGIDDAVAIAIALCNDSLDVKLITTVAGNVSLEKVTYNMLKLLKFYNKDVPVAKGAASPLILPLEDAQNVHGPSGLEGFDFEEPDESLLLKEHAVLAMRKVIVESEEKITLVPIGPLTNIALLFKLFPEVASNIEEIVLMGGSLSRGNKGVLSEFNIATDPEAAKIVFDFGVPIVMAGLDVGLKALVLPEDIKKLLELGRIGQMIHALFQRYRGGSIKTGLKMYDSCAIAYLLKPEMYEVQETYVGIELNGLYTKGATVVDLKGYLKKPHNAKVCIDINQDMFRSWFIEQIKKCNNL